MEVKHYLLAIRRHWLTVAGVAFATVLAVMFLGQSATEYETSGTYVIKPRSIEAGDSVRATEALNRGVEINATYARIARSDAVKERARQDLQDRGTSTDGLSASSEVIVGTNILQIGAAGPNPDAVAEYATAVGDATVAYLDALDEVYLLQPLDPPGDPKAAASNEAFTLLTGLTLGILAGAVLAFGLEYLREPVAPGWAGIWDPATGLYSNDYFRSRLRQELARCAVPPDLPNRGDSAARDGSSFSVSRVSLSSGDDPARRDAGQALLAQLRPQDVLAYGGDDSFIALFPDLAAPQVEEVLVEWQERLATTTRAWPSAIGATVQICECGADGLSGDDEIVRHVIA